MRFVSIFCSLILTACSLNLASAERPIDFNRDIRPILSANCFYCHGPDEETREADLRLDTAAGLSSDLGDYFPFVPGKVKESEAFRRMTSSDEDERMPPVDSNRELTPDQIELIKRWIEKGATWNRHWSFEPVQPSEAPQVKQKNWPRTKIDYYILAQLEAAALKPSPEADVVTLVRRLYLDLIGLPPTVEQAQQWVEKLSQPEKQDREAAYEELVDHLLAQPSYGERWARRWLDLARYADTNGYEKDRHRDIWRYRDWVINALNQDVPFDQFTIEQLAGDMLPNATLEQRVATGFHRNTMLNEEGGIDPLEFRFHAMTDRVATTGTTWLGLTTGCAQCHTHKYDPISHDEYYGMMALLNNADEPELPIPDKGIESRRKSNKQKAEKLLSELASKWPIDEKSELAPEKQRSEAIEKNFAKWLTEHRAHTVPWEVIRPSAVSSTLPLLTVEQDNAIFASGDTAKIDIYTIEFDLNGKELNSVLLETLPDERLPAGGPGSTYYEGTRGDFFLGEIRFFVDGKQLEVANATESFAKNRFGKNPVSALLSVDGDPQTGWAVHGRQGERHTANYQLKETIKNAKHLKIEMAFGRHYASSLGRFRFAISNSENSPKAYDLSPEVEQLLLLPDDQLSKKQREKLKQAFLLQAPELTKQATEIVKLLKPVPLPTTLVMQERPESHPRPTFRHHRGEFMQPKEQVTPKTIAAIGSLPEEAPKNRLTFARWIVSKEHPLTARVTVNRHWAALFGTGLVATLDDFGMQGETPSHPQLLDHLALSFMNNGWSMKQLHKQIVMSSVYRQSSQVTQEQLSNDPSNRLLSRMPRPRLEAEIIRDAALQAAGILSSKMGGPSVRPPQPAGVTEAAYGRPKWNASTGEDRYRRSIYTYTKRTAPFAMFNTFDAPSGEACVARRDVSNTALQSLTMLNDLMFLEAAQALGKEINASKIHENEKMRLIFQRVLTRVPSESEMKQLAEFVKKQQTRFTADQEKAKQVSGVQDETATGVAVWTTVARVLFNLDETVTRN